MRTTSLPVTLFPTSSTSPTYNSSDHVHTSAKGLALSCFTMILGIVCNLTALGILFNSRDRFRRHSKAPFLKLTVTLLFADLGGHMIPGAFAMYLHIRRIYKFNEIAVGFCYVFGASMVFFGLFPLLLGLAMAVERCVAITQPFFHVSRITVAHVKVVVLLMFCLPLVLAYLPFRSVGTYIPQYPNTWCFLPIHNATTVADKNVILAFSCLGLTALTLSLLCNILSGLTLLRTRMRSSKGYAKPTTRSVRRASSASSSSLFLSLDVEMMVQLAAVTVVSCVCWGPFLINSLMTQLNQRSTDLDDWNFTLLTLRLASCNQILDPWVYILLRRTVLQRVCCGFFGPRTMVISDSPSLDTRRKASILQ